jgi:NAD(P)-dependent dehydrogenase (short-subunit alcohol dehydrogenase family)
MMSYWRGKRAVVTGGSAGLGRAIANALVERGARVAIFARRQDALEATAAELRRRGADAIALSGDVTIPADVERLASTVYSAWGGLDLLCHCAGRSMRGTALSTTPEEFRELWETNFLSALRCAQAFAKTLNESRGHLVLIGSLASKVAAGYLGAYPASKYPLAALAQQLRMECGRHGMHVLLVCPGPIARIDTSGSSGRYINQVPDIPAAAYQPGGGAKVRAIDPNWLAARILRACERRQAELVVPLRARLLFTLSQLSPRLGDWLLRKMTT